MFDGVYSLFSRFIHVTLMIEKEYFGLDVPLSRIIVLGGRASSETVAFFADSHDLEVSFFCGHRQKSLTAFDGGLLHKRLNDLGHDVYFVDDIVDCDGGPYQLAMPGAILLSFGSPFPMVAE